MFNLHTHLEGRVRPATALELGRRLAIPEPAGGWAEALELPGPSDLTIYLGKVASTYPFFADPEALARVVSETVEDAATDGCRYLELRFGPATHVRPGFDLRAVIQAAVAGLRDGIQRTGMPAGLVVAALRHHDEATNLAVARAAAAEAGAGVVGFDLAGDELRFRALAPFVAAFGIAAAAGLGITCHAAEAAPAAAAREAVELLGVRRIGHGIHLAEDRAEMRWIAEHDVAVELCPTSNYFTGAISSPAQHPAAMFRDASIPLLLGDDNPRQTGSELSGERIVLRDELGFSDDDLRRLDAESIRRAFVDESVRRTWTASPG